MINEAIDSILRCEEGAILCKLDIEKGYDHVNCSFLCWVMERMSFGEKVDKLDQMVYFIS